VKLQKKRMFKHHKQKMWKVQEGEVDIEEGEEVSVAEEEKEEKKTSKHKEMKKHHKSHLK
jgi:hypothetical protein